ALIDIGATFCFKEKERLSYKILVK
ncbi:MAG: hypothetical protein ACJA0J_001972, partial [Bdellovibrionota bacterium]